MWWTIIIIFTCVLKEVIFVELKEEDEGSVAGSGFVKVLWVFFNLNISKIFDALDIAEEVWSDVDVLRISRNITFKRVRMLLKIKT